MERYLLIVNSYWNTSKISDYKPLVASTRILVLENVFERIFNSLENVVQDQIKVLKNRDHAEIFEKILNLVSSDNFSHFLEKINGLFEGKTILNLSFLPKTTDLFPVDKFFA